jgi:hypothetical protein
VSNDGGEKWILTYSSTPNFGANRSIAFGNGLFVTASDRGSFYSSDGVSWSVGIDSDSNRAFDGSIGFRSISFGMLASGQGRFVMSGENSTPTMYSNDGIHWYRSTIRFSGSVVTSLSSLQFFGGRFYGTSGHRAAASADGITWNAYLDSGGFFSIFGRFGVVGTEWVNPIYQGAFSEPSSLNSAWPMSQYAFCPTSTNANATCVNSPNQNYFSTSVYAEFE